MNALYPLKFYPVFKDKLWGGQRIRTFFGMDFSPLPNCGEAWVVSAVEGFVSVVSNGYLQGNDLNELIEVYMGDLVGEKVFEHFGTEFPILIKFIDAREWLSIQVHPDDALARRRGGKGGKTEMWYIIDADADSSLICGFNQKISKETYLSHLEAGKIQELMRYEPVKKGDVFYMPAGSVHALGPGILLAEIQQTSDTTYRIYDWDRTDENGKSRELHTNEAHDAIHFEAATDGRVSFQKTNNHSNNIISTPYFVSNFLPIKNPVIRDYGIIDSFVILICTEGSGVLGYEEGKINIRAGEAVLVPAAMEQIHLIPEGTCTFLEVYLDETLLSDSNSSNN